MHLVIDFFKCRLFPEVKLSRYICELKLKFETHWQFLMTTLVL